MERAKKEWEELEACAYVPGILAVLLTGFL